MTGLTEIVKELNRLDARDFDPVSQAEFLGVRGNLVQVGSYTKPTIQDTINPLLAVLNAYRGSVRRIVVGRRRSEARAQREPGICEGWEELR